MKRNRFVSCLPFSFLIAKAHGITRRAARIKSSLLKITGTGYTGLASASAQAAIWGRSSGRIQGKRSGMPSARFMRKMASINARAFSVRLPVGHRPSTSASSARRLQAAVDSVAP